MHRPLEQILQLAAQHLKARKLPEAEALCREILAHQPNQLTALQLLGMTCAEGGKFDEAADLMRQAIHLKPDWSDAHYNHGNILQMAGKPGRAIYAYRQALTLKPDWPQAWNNLGLAFEANGQLSEAIMAMERATALNPQNAIPWNNLGNTYKRSRQPERAIAAFRRAIAINPDLAEAYNNLSVVLKDTGDLQQSMTSSQRAIALRPGFAEGYNNFGATLEEAGRLDEAAEAFQKAISLNPRYAEAHYNLGNVLKSTRQLDAAIAAYRQALALRPGFVEADNNLLYTLHFHPDYSPAAIAVEHQRWNHQHAEPLDGLIQPHTNDRSPARRLRIGYVSPDFAEHPIGRFLLPLFTQHDRKEFEIFAYSQVAIGDSFTTLLRSNTDTWRNILGMTDDEAADLIRRDGIDILVDLTMHMARNRMLVFAQEPAPVQATWLAYCSTTGLETMDYRISDPHLDPTGSNLSVYSEQTIRLPETYWCYQPLNDCPEVSTLPVLQAGHVTFGSLNNFAKVSDPTLLTWAQILQAIPHSQLLLHAPVGNHRNDLSLQFQDQGIDPARIHFAEKASLADYFKLYHRIDIALDTFPYAGGTTTCDALWMGAPVITLAGKTAVGRGGVSILSNIGLPELIALSENNYIEIATALADDLLRLNELRTTLRQRMQQSPLMDAPRFARAMESAYRQMWRIWTE